MNYAQAKKEINQVRREISACRQRKSALEKELGDLNKERADANAQYRVSYKKKAQQEKAEYKEKLIHPVEEKLQKARQELSDLEKKHAEDLTGISVENMMENCSDSNSILKEIQESSENLDNVIVSAVGKDFAGELEKQLDSQSLGIDESKLDTVISYFNVCSSEIENISKRTDKIKGIVDKIQNTIMGIDVSDIQTDNKIGLALAAVFFILTVLLFKFVYPFYVFLLFITVVLNIKRNYKILKIILVHKAVKDNVSLIESMLHKKILEQVDAETARINEQFQKDSATLSAQVQQLEQQLQKTSIMAESSFSFDDASVREVYELSMRQKENRENNINDELHSIDENLSKLHTILNKKTEQLTAFLGTLQEEYLDVSKTGSNFKLTPKFFVDVCENKPVFFEHPMQSALFLYDKRSTVTDFIKLLNIQIRRKLNPTAFNVDVYDVATIGKEFLKFKIPEGSSNEAAKALFRILTTKDEFKKNMAAYNTEMGIRLKDIHAGHNNISEYNEFMISIDSLTMPYVFIFVQGFEISDLLTPEVSQLLTNGGDVGIFFHVFLEKDAFLKTKERSMELAECIQKFFVLEETGPKTRAKNWILSLFEDNNV